ncbi:MAG TPA: V-type ATP synthase subunit F [Vicinamibacterales bacterium]|nr:V-type ATP synthase subunit F [Vicinamibacterales bacterium]
MCAERLPRTSAAGGPDASAPALRAVVLGSLLDVTGFALAGVDGVVCATAAEVQSALQELTSDPGAAVILMSPECAAMAGDAVGRFQPRHETQLLVILPPSPPGDSGLDVEDTP